MEKYIKDQLESIRGFSDPSTASTTPTTTAAAGKVPFQLHIMGIEQSEVGHDFFYLFSLSEEKGKREAASPNNPNPHLASSNHIISKPIPVFAVQLKVKIVPSQQSAIPHPKPTALLYLDKVDSTGLLADSYEKTITPLSSIFVKAVLVDFIEKYAYDHSRDGNVDDHDSSRNRCARSRWEEVRVYVYCATSDQYLFAHSAKVAGKKVLSDRGLIKWWIRNLSVSSDMLDPSRLVSISHHAYIPGESPSTTKHLFPPSSHPTTSHPATSVAPPTLDTISWKWGLGHPLQHPASLLVQFPDDMITKAMGLLQDTADPTIKQVMDTMDILESHAGMRAELRLDLKLRENVHRALFSSSDSCHGDGAGHAKKWPLVSFAQWNCFMQALFGAQYGDLEGAVQSAKALVDLVVQFMAAAAERGHGDILTSPVSSFTVYLPVPSIKESKKRAAGDAAAATATAPARTLSMGLVKKKKQAVDHQVGAGNPVLGVAYAAPPVNTISATLIKKKKPKLMTASAVGEENGGGEKV